mmetsp:Transcript_17449/g.21309  ORF Transcript_17449/g.21309 Transcript_17449/m.21309 type:complete len:940 (-) Transcript_17449:31-2850(-)
MSLPNQMRPILPSSGFATVKSVLSGDTVVLTGRPAAPGQKAPVVIFTFERVTAPRMASKANGNIDDPGAFPAREWLRNLCVGKQVAFETRKQGATAGDRVYGLLFMPSTNGDDTKMNLAVEAVRQGHATPKVLGTTEDDPTTIDVDDPVVQYETALQAALKEAQSNGVGVHASSPLIRSIKNAGEEFQTKELIEKVKKICTGGTVTCVIEYIFDGSRFRAHVTDPELQEAGLQYANFTLILGGVASPRMGNPRLDPPTQSEQFADEAKQFVEVRLLHRELKISLHGTDKSGICAVGTVHHPRGNIGVELLKNGLARVSDWSVRMMNPLDVPAFRFAENAAKRTNTGVWHSYAPPTLSGDSEIVGQVIEVITGDTLAILPAGEAYNSEDKLKKVSLASVRAPRVGNEKLGRDDEAYAIECKERLRVLCAGKNAKVSIHYERDIPMRDTTEKRQFGTISVGKRADVGEVLVSEGLAVTQHHRDDEEKSPNYDILVAAEVAAKQAKKGISSGKDYKKPTINDLTVPQKAKAYSGSLMRAGKLKAIVEYVFNGSRFKVFVPSENCHIMFALEDLKAPQPNAPSSAIIRGQVRPAEPFGDASKRHARLTVLQRTVEITCSGVTQGGIIKGDMFVGTGGQRRDFSLEMVGAGLAMVDQRKIDYGEASKTIVDAQNRAKTNKVGLWSLYEEKEQPTTKASVKAKERTATVKLSEIRSGSNFFVQFVGDEAADVVDKSMRIFTADNGTAGAPCDLRVGKTVAALFDDGSGKLWYRAKVLEKSKIGKAKVLFIDYGNVSSVSIKNELRPLDVQLGPERIPPAAKEAILAGMKTRSLEEDDGLEAARYLQDIAWGKELTTRIFCEAEGKLVVTLYDQSRSTSINEDMISEGLARVTKKNEVEELCGKMINPDSFLSLVGDLNIAEQSARKTHSGMWRYGDIGDDDDDEY